MSISPIGRIALFAFATVIPASAATLLSETFDNITTLPGADWVQTNNSTAGGLTAWFQGLPAPTAFDANSGAADSYIGANFNNAAFAGNISNWLISPVINFNGATVLTFFTRTTGGLAIDNLEVRLNNSSTTDVGATDSSTGDFSNLLLTINPGLTLAGYPSVWTQYSVNANLTGTARLAFRYVVSDTSVNADYIGIDDVVLSDTVPEPSTFGIALGGLLFLAASMRRKQ